MDELDWKALARLAATPDGQRLLAILQRRREDCRDRLESADATRVPMEQGVAKTIKELMDDLNKAREVVNKRFNN